MSYRPACNARGIMSSGSSTAEQGISKPIGFLGSFGNNLADLRGEYEFENTTDAERGGTPRHRYSTRTHSEKKKSTHSTKKSTGKLKVKVTFTKPPLMLSEPSPDEWSVLDIAAATVSPIVDEDFRRPRLRPYHDRQDGSYENAINPDTPRPRQQLLDLGVHACGSLAVSTHTS